MVDSMGKKLYLLVRSLFKFRSWCADLFRRAVSVIARGPRRNVVAFTQEEEECVGLLSELETIPDITSGIRTLSSEVAQGGFADVFRGEWTCTVRRRDGVRVTVVRQVAIKALRCFLNTEYAGDVDQRLRHEVDLTHRARHVNIVELYGISYHMDGRPSIIIPWYPNQTARQFVRANPSADRLRLIADVSQGLLHLHLLSPPIIHCDLKASNVLIAADGTGVISDFGASHTAGGPYLGALPFTRNHPPEFISQDNPPTTASDMWSMACTACEILTEQFPYSNRNPLWLIGDMVSGVKPFLRPISNSQREEALWRLYDACWSRNPETRPSALEFLETVQDFGSQPWARRAPNLSRRRSQDDLVDLMFTCGLTRQILTC